MISTSRTWTRIPTASSSAYRSTSRRKPGRHFVGSADLFADRDKDDLDPDHIPIRWDVHLGTDGEFWQGDRTHLGWTANFDTRMNTVSSVEREMTALPAIVGRYDGNPARLH